MSTKKTKPTPVAVPADDGSIERALGDLDATIASWMDEVNRFVKAAKTAAEADRNAERSAGAATDAKKAPPDAAAVKAEAPPVDDDAAAAPQPARAETAAADEATRPDAADSPNEDVNVGPGCDAEPDAEIEPCESPGAAESTAAPAKETKGDTKEDDDEALLATLDAETAKAVRIR
ncbi:MAG: hypothetical protein V3T70_07875, partial [Phycisphaerae bacterium]